MKQHFNHETCHSVITSRVQHYHAGLSNKKCGMVTENADLKMSVFLILQT